MFCSKIHTISTLTLMFKALAIASIWRFLDGVLEQVKTSQPLPMSCCLLAYISSLLFVTRFTRFNWRMRSTGWRHNWVTRSGPNLMIHFFNVSTLEPKYITYYSDSQIYNNGNSMDWYHKVPVIFIFPRSKIL